MRSLARLAWRVASASALLVAVVGTATAQKPSEDPRETNPFVLAYHCEGGDTVAVAYPAFKDARTQPIRLSWDGKRYVMTNVRAASGARYVTQNQRLEWWTRGNTAFLAVPGVNPPILANCETF